MYEDDLTNLDDWLRRLKVEYGIYFNGHRKKPPDDLKARVEKLVKKLSEVQNMSYSERFRYNTLITRFYVLRDLWRRTIMQREQSGEVAAEAAAGRSANAGTSVARVSIADPSAEETKVHELYDALLEARKMAPNEATSIAYSQFAGYISRQTQSIRDKYHCARVVFSIEVEEGAIRFKAAAETRVE
ncbi:MAG TPA: MXAN_5187 C-terminal domain-containing protein [Acidobacteriota bacterium]|nr:MXAN_5187 C-terminal domain-containing protein [Acidobacteriota bacterium]